MFLIGFVCLSVCPSLGLFPEGSGRICMKLRSGVCPGPNKCQVDFENDPITIFSFVGGLQSLTEWLAYTYYYFHWSCN